MKYKVTINGRVYETQVASGEATLINEYCAMPLQADMTTAPKPVVKKEVPAQILQAEGTLVASPLPGTILDIVVKEGDRVDKGQTILILEAMKMENEIAATVGGVVVQIIVQEGDSVSSGTPLLVIN